MPPRDEDPPRRGHEPRRGASRSTDRGADRREVDGGRGFDGSISDARAYTPRGRTIRESDERPSRTADPFRPALQVLDGGKPIRGRRTRPPAAQPDDDRAGKGRPRRDGAGAAQDQSSAGQPPAKRGGTRGRTAGSAGGDDRARAPRTGDARASRTGDARASRTGDAGGRAKGRGPTGRTTTPGRTRPGGRPAPPVPVEPPRLADPRRRLRLGTVLALALFLVIGGRLVTYQVVDTPAYAQSVLEQRQSRLSTVALPAPRGAIYDRSGSVLARSIEARYIYVDPELVQDVLAVAAQLSPLLGIPRSTLAAKMARKKRPGGGWSRFEYLARGVDVAVAERITALNLPGIGAHRDERRDVPGADLAANLIGFTGEDLTGLEGIEARYDELLRGQDGQRIFEIGNPHVDMGQLAKEIPGGYRRETPAQPGSSLVLTIDRDLQFAVQRILSATMASVDAAIGAAVVLDVRTGEVLAQASHPTYNAAKPFDHKPTEREDVATSVVVDPGSVHKALVFAAALEEGVVRPDSTVTVGPALRRGGARFQDTHPHPKGTKVTLPGLMAYSSNVGTILLAERLGPQRLYEYQQRFGLGRASGVGVPGEASGRLLAPKEWSGSSYGSVPIGHSVDATVIQMAAAFAAMANDGTYIQPHLIRETVAADGSRTAAPQPVVRRVIGADNARALRTMMEAVVTVKGATGNRAAIDGYRVAGKTGTGKRLIDGRYTSYETGSFIGMAPAEDPRYVIAVFADTPGGGGGTVAGPAFRRMMEFTLAHYRVPPSGTRPPKFTIVP